MVVRYLDHGGMTHNLNNDLIVVDGQTPQTKLSILYQYHVTQICGESYRTIDLRQQFIDHPIQSENQLEMEDTQQEIDIL